MKFIRLLEYDMHRRGIRLIGRLLFNMNYQALFLIRVVTWSGKRTFITKLAQRRLQMRYGIVVHNTNRIGSGLRMGHPWGIILGDTVEIGDNCTIMQNVTIGRKDLANKNEIYPKIKDNVVIGAGAIVLGEIVVESNTIIGANAVVLNSTESNSVYAGVPAKRIK